MSLALAAVFLIGITAGSCKAEIAGEEAFANISWEHAFSVSLDGGGLQGFCVTDDRIIFIQNTSTASTEPDKVFAYYLNDTDRYGNPVQQYTLADMRDDQDWEHGNCLTYNPVTNRVYVAFATNLAGYNQGSIGVMDPETLGMVDVIQLSEDYRILGISYIKERDIYLVQAEAEGGFRFVLFDSEFNQLQELGTKSPEPGRTYQGMCVTEDYVVIPPALREGSPESYINVFSLRSDSEAPIVTGVNELGLEGYERVEAEAIAETGPGRYMMNVFAVNAQGEREYHFYTAEIPYYYNVTVDSNMPGAESGNFKVLRGDSFAVPYEENDSFILSGISVDGTEMSREECLAGYSFDNIQSDHSVQIMFRDRYPAPLNYGSGESGNIVDVEAASVNDVYGEYGRSVFSNAVAEVNDAFNETSMKMMAGFVGTFVEGGKFAVIIGEGVGRSLTRSVLAVSQGLLRHRRILTRTCNMLLMFGGSFGLLILRVRAVRRKKIAHAKVTRAKLKEEIRRVYGELYDSSEE